MIFLKIFSFHWFSTINNQPRPQGLLGVQNGCSLKTLENSRSRDLKLANHKARCQFKKSKGAFFWDWPGYPYSGLEVTEYTEFRFPKERSLLYSFWKRNTHGGGDLRTAMSSNRKPSIFSRRHAFTRENKFEFADWQVRLWPSQNQFANLLLPGLTHAKLYFPTQVCKFKLYFAVWSHL